MNEIRVLIVDDEPMVAQINKRFTEGVEGFVVVGIATDGKQALEMLTTCQPELIILDIYMPEIDGAELLAVLRKQEVPVDIILVTAANDGEMINRIMRYGVMDYIIKPFKFDRYRSTLENYRAFKDKLVDNNSFSQGELDKFFLAKKTKINKTLPKSLHAQTLDSIIVLLTSKDTALSADEVAEEMGISRVTVRRYLEYLVGEGKMEMLLEYLPVGRPIHRFKMK